MLNSDAFGQNLAGYRTPAKNVYFLLPGSGKQREPPQKAKIERGTNSGEEKVSTPEHLGPWCPGPNRTEDENAGDAASISLAEPNKLVESESGFPAQSKCLLDARQIPRDVLEEPGKPDQKRDESFLQDLWVLGGLLGRSGASELCCGS